VEVVGFCVYSDEDNSIICSKGEDGGHGESLCRELTTLWVARLDDGTELKVADPKEQQGDVEEKEAEDEEGQERVGCRGRRAGCC